MKCPFCSYPDSKVLDSRPIAESNSIRRRRECLSCQKRFTTYESIETVQIIVTKKNGSKELFDKSKLLTGIMKACQKRPIDPEYIANDIEAELVNTLRQEITTMEIGEMVMTRLKKFDEVAYVRFASVYKEFKDLDSFVAELEKLKKQTE